MIGDKDSTAKCREFSNCCGVLLQALPKALGTKAKRHLEVLFDWALPACLRFLRKELQEISPTEDAGLARGAMRIIEACLDDFREGALFLCLLCRHAMVTACLGCAVPNNHDPVNYHVQLYSLL
jgi:hypothetical protein